MRTEYQTPTVSFITGVCPWLQELDVLGRHYRGKIPESFRSRCSDIHVDKVCTWDLVAWKHFAEGEVHRRGEILAIGVVYLCRCWPQRCENEDKCRQPASCPRANVTMGWHNFLVRNFGVFVPRASCLVDNEVWLQNSIHINIRHVMGLFFEF